jgi:hypothetical protein
MRFFVAKRAPQNDDGFFGGVKSRGGASRWRTRVARASSEKRRQAAALYNGLGGASTADDPRFFAAAGGQRRGRSIFRGAGGARFAPALWSAKKRVRAQKKSREVPRLFFLL